MCPVYVAAGTLRTRQLRAGVWHGGAADKRPCGGSGASGVILAPRRAGGNGRADSCDEACADYWPVRTPVAWTSMAGDVRWGLAGRLLRCWLTDCGRRRDRLRCRLTGCGWRRDRLRGPGRNRTRAFRHGQHRGRLGQPGRWLGPPGRRLREFRGRLGQRSGWLGLNFLGLPGRAWASSGSGCSSSAGKDECAAASNPGPPPSTSGDGG
jgi:hypothetical protein